MATKARKADTDSARRAAAAIVNTIEKNALPCSHLWPLLGPMARAEWCLLATVDPRLSYLEFSQLATMERLALGLALSRVRFLLLAAGDDLGRGA